MKDLLTPQSCTCSLSQLSNISTIFIWLVHLLPSRLQIGSYWMNFLFMLELPLTFAGVEGELSLFFKRIFKEAGTSCKNQRIIGSTRWRHSYKGPQQPSTQREARRQAGSGYGPVNLNPPRSGLSPHPSWWTACLIPLMLTYGCLHFTFSYTIRIKRYTPTHRPDMHACTQSFTYCTRTHTCITRRRRDIKNLARCDTFTV